MQLLLLKTNPQKLHLSFHPNTNRLIHLQAPPDVSKILFILQLNEIWLRLVVRDTFSSVITNSTLQMWYVRIESAHEDHKQFYFRAKIIMSQYWRKMKTDIGRLLSEISKCLLKLLSQNILATITKFWAVVILFSITIYSIALYYIIQKTGNYSTCVPGIGFACLYL